MIDPKSIIVGLVAGGGLGLFFGWVLYQADVRVDDFWFSTEPATTPIAAVAAETNYKPSAYEILMKDPAEYCNGQPLGINGSNVSPYGADLYCIESGQLIRYDYRAELLVGGDIGRLTLSKRLSIGVTVETGGYVRPRNLLCPGQSDERLAVSSERVTVDGAGRWHIYEVWCASGTQLSSQIYSRHEEDDHYKLFSVNVVADEFTILRRVGPSLPQ